MFALNDRQQSAFEAVFHALDQGVGRQLVALPTGTGKTVLAAHIALRFRQALFLVHRQELLEQTIRTFKGVSPEIELGILWGKLNQTDHPVVVGMIQTVHARLSRLEPDRFDCVVLDEAHHAAARTWREVADHFRPRLRLGLSATPERADGAPLSNLFDAITYQMTLKEAIDEGLLVPPSAVQVLTYHNLDGVRVMAGDLNEGDLQQCINTEKRNRLVAQKYREYAPDRKAIIFCAGVEHSKAVAAVFAAQGLKADWVSCYDPERERKIEGFAGDGIHILCNAMILTEGFDNREVSAILLARPTRSRPLYAQMLGRGLRLAEGKEDCQIIDFVDSTSSHSLMTAWRFFGLRGGCVKEKPFNPTEATKQGVLLEMAVDSYEELSGWRPSVKAVDRLVNILAPPPEVDEFTYGGREWHYAEATEKQLDILSAHGYDTLDTDWTRGQASAVIGQLPASQKQIRLLLALGYDVLTYEWTRRQASTAIEQAYEQGKKPEWEIYGSRRHHFAQAS